MEILIKAAQLILSLSILVTLHELGHFIPAKLFKCRVDKFYLFFDAWFSLFKIKKGETEYGIGWIPLGGYVKIAGMIDESMDTEQLKAEPQPWEFRSKPAWQRLIIMLGGVTVNALLGVIIYAGVLFYWGSEMLPNASVTNGIAVDSLGIEMGLRNGDKIMQVEGKPMEDFSKISSEIILSQARTLQIERDGQLINIDLSKDYIPKLIKNKTSFLAPRFPFVIDDFVAGSVGAKAGLIKGDKIVGLDSFATPFFNDFVTQLQAHKNKAVTVNVLRNGTAVNIKLTVPQEGKLGIAPVSMLTYFKTKKIEYSLLECIPAGWHKAGDTFTSYIRQFKLIFNTETKGYKQLGGFLTLGSAFAPTWDWQVFWGFTAFLSIALAVMNLLPIPALDGGHVLFTLYEIITRRKPNEKFLEYAQVVGMVLLFGLMLLSNANDVLRLFGLNG
jgi:regulator of sigma E protease